MAHGILVVDGSNLSRTVLRSYLKKELPEADLDIAASGAQALALLADRSDGYALVTTALVLPDMDGLDLCREIRKSRAHRISPVVVVSSDADERLARGAFAAGVTEFFDKARGVEALGEFIKEFVQRNPGHVGRVLYVEDSKTAAMWGCKMMDRHGLQVDYYASAEEAMLRLEDSRLPMPDVVVTDYYLSGELTGEDLLRFIRADRRYLAQELPVLVLTGRSGTDRQADVLLKGANDFIEKPMIEEIFMARIRSLLFIKQSFDALRRQSDHMRRMAFTDSLTGARNKRYLLDFADELTAGSKQPIAVIILDIDHFKRINDTYGHLVGDKVLAEVGGLLRDRFPNDNAGVVCRFGGEEFVIVLPNSDKAAAVVRAKALRVEFEALRPANVPITASLGVAVMQRGEGLSRLVARADQALYHAKNSGRNRVCFAERSGLVPS